MATILCIDDGEEILLAVSRLLSRRGHIVRPYSCPRAAIAAIGSDQPDLVLLDWQMPEMSGEAVLRQLRQSHRDLPIIIYSSNPKLAAARQHLMGAGASDVCDKSVPALLKILERLNFARRQTRSDETLGLG